MPAIETRAVLPPGSWRDARAYTALAATGARGLAWELLRRDPDYPGGGDEREVPLTATDPAFTARWGLHFRRGPGTRNSVGWGKSVYDRVNLGGRRIYKKQNHHTKQLHVQ